MTQFRPADIDELREAVAEALAAEEPLEIVGGGSKRALGRPLQTAHTFDLLRFARTRDSAQEIQGVRRLRSEEHTSELQSLRQPVCPLLLEKKHGHGF